MLAAPFVRFVYRANLTAHTLNTLRSRDKRLDAQANDVSSNKRKTDLIVNGVAIFLILLTLAAKGCGLIS